MRFWNWLRKQKKETIVAAVTLLIVLTAGVTFLFNASKLQNIFDPEKFERFGERQEGESYDSVAGDGLESDLADRDKDGSSRDDEEGQKAVKAEGVKPQELEKSDNNEGIGQTVENSATAGNMERNPDAYEITDNEDNDNTIGTGGQGLSGDNNGSGKNTEDSGKPGEGGEGGIKPSPDPEPGTDPVPGPVLSGDEQQQLRPRDPIYTEDGELLTLSVKVPEDWMFCVGDMYHPEGIVVQAIFRQNGRQMEKTLSYGGPDGYSVVFSADVPGNHTAIFLYHGLTATAGYQVLSSHASIRYYAEAEGKIYASAAFPGLVSALVSEGDEVQREELEKMGSVVYPSTGSVIDLTQYHCWMIAYLGDERIQQTFAGSSDTNFKSVTFLETDEDGYLTNMLGGFQYFLSSALQDDGGPYLYYPASADWGQVSRTLVDVVKAVPEGYKIRREISGGTENLPEYLGEQVLERYMGTEATLVVPMGVTKVDFKEVADKEQVTELCIPESVREINTESIAECLPNLKAYSCAQTLSGHNGLKVVNGVLYSADGSTLLSVPPGMTNMPEWPSEVTAIAAGAFRGSQIAEITVPETVVRFEPDCFAGVQADTIHIVGRAAPGPGRAAATGYKGMILTQDSLYDTVLKNWMFAFANEALTFGTESGKSENYRYDKGKNIIVYQDQPTRLAGIPSDTLGMYQVPEGITAVGAGAFLSCGGLYDIELPESVKRLEGESLILPEGVESLFIQGNAVVEISPQLFGNPESGAVVPDIAVYVPEELYDNYLAEWKKILDPVYGEGSAEKLLQSGSGGFFYEDRAKYQTIPGSADTYRLVKLYDPASVSFRVKSGTIEIAENAFAGLDLLEIVYLPDSVAEIGKNAFSGCSSLQTVASEAKSLKLDSQILSAESGAANIRVYEAGKSYQKFIYGENGEVYGLAPGNAGTLLDVPTDYEGVFTLRAGTVSLNQEAFLDCMRLTGLTGSDAELTDIGDSCFENCMGLKIMDLSMFTELKKIGDYLFRSCESLEELVLPDGLADISEGMCYGCTDLTRFHAAGLRTLGDGAFAYCSRMGNMNLAEVTKLGARAFMGCSSATQMELPETLKEMGEECFRDCASLQKIQMNGALTAISRYAFAGCKNLASFVMSERQKNALRVVGVQAFADCASLESADFGECTALQQMGAEAFSGCGYLTRVTLPETLTALPDRCFAGCGYLSILELLSETAPELGEQIFGDEISPYLHLWVRKPTIGEYRQAYSVLLDQGYGNGTTENILGVIDPQKEIIRGVIYRMTEEGRVLVGVEPVVNGEVTVFQDTVRIADDAFRDCLQLTMLELPDGSSVSLGDRCFLGCSALKEVRLYGDILQWGEDTFRDCTAICSVEMGNRESDQIVRVGDRAFQNCTGLVGNAAVTFRAQITSLGTECFSGCSQMGSPAVTAGFREHLEQIEARAFEGCKSLSTLLNSNYAGLKIIGNYAFTDCDAMRQPSIPAGVTSIGEGCFAECDTLQYVSFYCGLEEYPENCFRNCPKLIRTGGTAEAFQSLRRIGEGAYEGCVSLQMPLEPVESTWHLGRYENLEEIGKNAFRGCGTVELVRVPSTVKKIGAGAFAGCTKLQTMEFLSVEAPEMEADVLDGTDSLSRIQVPQGDSAYLAYLEKLIPELGEKRTKEILVSAEEEKNDH